MGSSALRSVPAGPGRLTLLEELSALPTAELRSQLTNLLGLTAGNLLRLACIVTVLEDRGEDMTAFKGGFLNILRKIACGELLPDLVVLFAAEPEKIKRAGALPIADQEDIVAGRKIVEEPKRSHHRRPGSTSERAANGTRSYGPTVGRLHDPATSASRQPTLAMAMGGAGNPKDVGETAAEMILACSSPKDAARVAVEVLTRAGIFQAQSRDR